MGTINTGNSTYVLSARAARPQSCWSIDSHTGSAECGRGLLHETADRAEQHRAAAVLSLPGPARSGEGVLVLKNFREAMATIIATCSTPWTAPSLVFLIPMRAIFSTSGRGAASAGIS